MKKRRRIKQQRLIDALEQTRGNVLSAARLLGCARDVFYEHLGLDYINEVRDRAHDWRVDVAEAQLDKRLMDGDERALYYVLNKIGRRRGWEPAEVQIDIHQEQPTRPVDWDAVRYRELLRELMSPDPDESECSDGSDGNG